MFKNCTYEEDKIYCLLNLFNIKMEIKYEIGLKNALRNLSKELNSEDLSCLLLCNWYPENETPLDLNSLPTFNKNTTAVWFNMINPVSKCKYILNIGVKIYSKIIKCNIKILNETTNETMFSTISDVSNLDIQELEINEKFIAYGRILYDSNDVFLIKIGKFQRVNSVLTGAVEIRGDWTCYIICKKNNINNNYNKIGICIADDEEFKNYIKDNIIIG